jgi:hypothetical protein
MTGLKQSFNVKPPSQQAMEPAAGGIVGASTLVKPDPKGASCAETDPGIRKVKETLAQRHCLKRKSMKG